MLVKLRNKNLYDMKIFLLRRIQGIIYPFIFGKFGNKSVIEKALVIRNPKKVYIENNVTIRKNSRIEMVDKYNTVKYDAKLEIEEGVVIEFNCHITCAKKIIIKRNVMIAGYVTIIDNNHGYENVNLAIKDNNLTKPKEIIIGEESFIGMGSVIMPGVQIGKHCVIGANSVVTKNIPNYSVVVGNPAKIIKRYNLEKNKWQKVNEKGEFLNE